MQLYVADYLGDTTHLTTEQHGAYLLLLMTMWRAGGTLPDDDAKLARIVRLTSARWKSVRREIIDLFDVADGVFTQKRLKAELEKAQEKSAKRADAGRVGGSSKALKSNKVDVANASVLPKHSSEPEPEPEPEPKVKSSLRSDAPLPEGAGSEITEAFDAYNVLAQEVGWPKAQVLTPKRRSGLRARLIEVGGIAGWGAAMAKARASPFLRGESGRDKAHETWVPDLDFFLQQSSLMKLMEGRYDQRSSNSKSQGFDAIREGARGALGLDPRSGQRLGDEGDQLQRLALFANGG